MPDQIELGKSYGGVLVYNLIGVEGVEGVLCVREGELPVGSVNVYSDIAEKGLLKNKSYIINEDEILTLLPNI